MIRKKIISQEHRFVALFISLLLMIVVSPFFLSRPYGELVVNGLSFMIIMTSIYSLRDNKRYVTYLLLLAIAILIVTLLKSQHFTNCYQWLDFTLSFIFYCLVAIMLVSIVLDKEEITRDLVFAALNAYLLIGVAFGTLYELINFFSPYSFIYNNGYNTGVVHPYDLIYFSFTTLSTVGFGDIVAINSQARAIIILEEVTGIFYLAVLVARLVGSMSYRNKN